MRDEVMQSRPETEEDRKFIEMVKSGELELIPSSALSSAHWKVADPSTIFDDLQRGIKEIKNRRD